nr:T9SS type A sorting domain-containing protein [uncultured Pedobacter sp.]
MKKIFTLSVMLLIANVLMAQFTSGNLVLARYGNGQTSLGNLSSNKPVPLTLIEYDINTLQPTGFKVPIISGAIPGQRFSLPGNQGANTSIDGMVTRSEDGRYLMVAGYDLQTTRNNASPDCSPTSDPKMIIRVDNAGHVDYAPINYAQGLRNVTSINGEDMYVSGALNGQGVFKSKFSNTTDVSTIESSTIYRNIKIVNGQLYGTGVYKMGVGLPENTANTSLLPGFTALGSNLGLLFLDTDPNISNELDGNDLLYLTDNLTSNGKGIIKYYYDPSDKTWHIANGNPNTSFSGALFTSAQRSTTGLTGFYIPPVAPATQGKVRLFYIEGNSVNNLPLTSTPNAFYTLLDENPRNSVASTPTPALIETADPRYFFRDVTFVPELADNTAPSKPTGSSAVSSGDTVTVSWSAPTNIPSDFSNYMVVRYESAPTVNDNPDPKINYSLNSYFTQDNFGTVVYRGPKLNFQDTNPHRNINYYYRVYAFDHALNYSNPDETSVAVNPTFTEYIITQKSIMPSNDPTSYLTNTLSGVTRVEALDSYGGSLADYVGNSKGYFNTYEDANGNWSLLDPDGYRFYSLGVNSVEQGGGLGPIYNMKSIYANTMGNFSDTTLISIPYCLRLTLGFAYRGTTTRLSNLYSHGILAVFDPDFVSFSNARAASLITSDRLTDKNLIGYFSDNEMPLGNSIDPNNTLLDKWLNVNNYGGQSTANTDANYLAAVNWVKSRHGGVLATPTSADKAEWPGMVAGRYFSVCRDAIRASDTNHLYLGSRMNSDLINQYLFAAAGEYVDVLSVNNYHSWALDRSNDRYDTWETYAQKPFIVTEFYAQADDSGLPNASGAGYKVKTQQDRADFFEHFTMELLKRKYNVGFQYFKYKDTPANNTGILDNNYKWWGPMRNSFIKISEDVYRLRDFLLTTQSSQQFSSSYVKKGLNADYLNLKTNNNNIKIYPIPADKVIYLSIKGRKPGRTLISLFDLSGKLVLEKEIQSDQTKIDVDHLIKGIYILTVQQNGTLLNKSKIIIN